MKWYLEVIKKYAQFEGRARRKEYWMFLLINGLIIIATMIIDNVLGTTVGEEPYGIFYGIYALAVFIPGLAVSVRRLHDTGKSGWMLLIGLIPLIGGIWLLVLFATEGEHGINQYGSNPKNMDLAYEELRNDANKISS